MKKTLEMRIGEYNTHFYFLENPEDFNFNLSPVRMIYRNEALRTGNRDLYAGYLSEYYPNEMAAELQDFDKKIGTLVKMDETQVKEYMDENGYNLLQGDLHMSEQDCIFFGVRVDKDNIDLETVNNIDDYINPIARIEDVFLNKEWTWIIKG